MMLLDDSRLRPSGLQRDPDECLAREGQGNHPLSTPLPPLHPRVKYSAIFTARKTKGLNVMEVIRNLSQIDGKQLINEKNGAMVFIIERIQ